MAIKLRTLDLRADQTSEINMDPNALTDTPAASSGMPEILAPADSNSPISTIITDSSPGAGTAPITSTMPTLTSSSSTGQITTVTTVTSHSSASSTGAAATSHNGLSPGILAVVIVVPIAIVAVIIPFIVFWFLERQRKSKEKRMSQRHSREAMISKESGPIPERPQQTVQPDVIPLRKPEKPKTPVSRNSLGLFNFELSPPSTPHSGVSSPRFRFSIARALEIHRSQPSMIQARTSTTPSSRPATSESSFQRGRDIEMRQSRSSNLLEPPPLSASPHPSDSAAMSRFAPLERIGTQRSFERPNAAKEPNDTAFAAGLHASPYPSSEINLDIDGIGRIASPSPVTSNFPAPPPPPPAVSRKPNPGQAVPLRPTSTSDRSPFNDRQPITSQAPTESQYSTLSGPFSSFLPERVSAVSRLSFDPQTWSSENTRHSDMSAIISPVDDDESLTIHPHQII